LIIRKLQLSLNFITMAAIAKSGSALQLTACWMMMLALLAASWQSTAHASRFRTAIPTACESNSMWVLDTNIAFHRAEQISTTTKVVPLAGFMSLNNCQMVAILTDCSILELDFHRRR
jgi:hypothetical protein